MTRKIAFVITLLLCLHNLNAQQVKICMQSGYGFYNMNTLSSITNDVLPQLPFEAKKVSNYPPYIYYQPMVKIGLKRVELGLTYTFQTTGSKISSKDYSGEYKFATSINGNSLGFYLGSVPTNSSRFHFGYFLQMGITFSNFKIKETLQVDTNVNSSDYKFTGNSFYIEPGIKLDYTINSKLAIEANLAYFKEVLRNDYELNGARQNKIEMKKSFDDSDMWDGFRLGITLSYELFK